jgi:hypothetical protein
MREITFKFSNRVWYTFIAIGVLLLIGVGVYAYGGTQPTLVGHSAGELSLSGGVNGDAIFNKKVGIGTSNPLFDLEIKNTGNGGHLVLRGDSSNHPGCFAFRGVSDSITLGGMCPFGASTDAALALYAAGDNTPDLLIYPGGEVRLYNTDTGTNPGTQLCIDSQNHICKCGKCA